MCSFNGTHIGADGYDLQSRRSMHDALDGFHRTSISYKNEIWGSFHGKYTFKKIKDSPQISLIIALSGINYQDIISYNGSHIIRRSAHII